MYGYHTARQGRATKRLSCGRHLGITLQREKRLDGWHFRERCAVVTGFHLSQFFFFFFSFSFFPSSSFPFFIFITCCTKCESGTRGTTTRRRGGDRAIPTESICRPWSLPFVAARACVSVCLAGLFFFFFFWFFGAGAPVGRWLFWSCGFFFSPQLSIVSSIVSVNAQTRHSTNELRTLRTQYGCRGNFH